MCCELVIEKFVNMAARVADGSSESNSPRMHPAVKLSAVWRHTALEMALEVALIYPYLEDFKPSTLPELANPTKSTSLTII